MRCNKKQQLKIGLRIEKEHSHLFPKEKRKSMTKKIALDHIKEFPCYYKEIKKLETKLSRRKNK